MGSTSNAHDQSNTHEQSNIHEHHNGHSHAHGHSHSHAPESTKALVRVLVFTTVVFFAELFGGIISGSLALISDAMHMLSDATGLIVAASAAVMAQRGASGRATFGYKRVEVMAALVNGLAVSAVAVWIVVEAVGRLRSHTEVDAKIMLVIGTIGLLANLIGVWILNGHRGESMNVEGAFLHVLSDLLGSVAVVVAAVLIMFSDFHQADTIASFIIAGLILPRSLKLVAKAVSVLLEHAPSQVDTVQIEQALEELPNVQAVHDLHVWSLDGNEMLATCHLVVDTNVVQCLPECSVLDAAQQRLAEFGIGHSTIQLESAHHSTHERVCD